MNKFKLTFLALMLICAFAYQVQAQEKTPFDNKELLKEVKKEKLRKPIKISEALKAYEQRENAVEGKKTRATEIKISPVTSPTAEEGEAHIAMDPSNNNNLVMSYMNNNSATGLEFPIYTSNNAGQSWTKSSFNSLVYLSEMYPNGFVAGGGDPIFAYDKTGKLYFSWIYLVFDVSTPDTAFACMFWASSTNNGSTWTVLPGKDRYIGITALDVNTFESFSNYEGMYDRQWFATDLTNGANANALYCSFVYFPNMSESQNLTGQHVKKKLAGSATFNTTKSQVNSGQSQFGNVAVTQDGKLHVTFADLNNSSVKHAVSSDGGNTFSTPNQIATGTNLFGNQGGGYIHDRENSAVNLIAGGGNHLYVVWSDFPNFAGPGYDSYFSHSSDGGVTWSPAANLSTIFGTTNKGFMPTVCAHNNKVSIGAYMINNSKVSDYYMVTSTNNGTTWGTPTKVSTQSTDFAAQSNLTLWFGDYYNAVRNDTKVYNIWSDGRGTSGPKMYVSVTTENGTVWPAGYNEITPINATFSLEQYYPNPVQDILNLDFSASTQNTLSIQLISMEGKVVKEKTKLLQIGSTKTQLNLNGLAKGNYVLKLKNEDNTILTRLVTKN
jgi:hypothetical protein